MRTATRKKAIQYIEECRDIHKEWVGLEIKGRLTKEEMKIGGAKVHHRKWVKRYEVVLQELNK